MKMVALKRFHYPSGMNGRDYHEGDEVEVLSDRDAVALRKLRLVKDVSTAEEVVTSQNAHVDLTSVQESVVDKPHQEVVDEPPPQEEQKPPQEEEVAPKRPRYRRRDMEPEGQV